MRGVPVNDMEFFDSIEVSPVELIWLALASSIVAGLSAALLAGPARRLDWVSRSRRDRFGRGHVPLSGGPGLLLGGILALAALGVRPAPGALVAAGGFFLVGLIDDRSPLRPAAKLAAQGVVGLGAAWLLAGSWGLLGLALLVLLVLVNASNYLDNMDGLLAGVALTQALGLLLFDPALGGGLGASLLLVALPGVALLTLPPARVYLGDSGSHLIGALLALDALHLLFGREGLRVRFFLPLLVLFAVPLADAAVVTISRLRRGRPLFRGGTDHLSHRLVRLGFPPHRAVLVLVLASGACGVASLLLVFAS